MKPNLGREQQNKSSCTSKTFLLDCFPSVAQGLVNDFLMMLFCRKKFLLENNLDVYGIAY
jgi:hypothetical protein